MSPGLGSKRDITLGADKRVTKDSKAVCGQLQCVTFFLIFWVLDFGRISDADI